MTIDKYEREILQHTMYRAAQQRFCCHIADPVMQRLVDKGLMEDLGGAGFLPKSEHYYTITGKGRAVLWEQPGA